MIKTGLKWIKVLYKRTIASIAFLPAIIALSFLLLSFLMILLDFSETGKAIKLNLGWISLKDASTARSIISAIVNGIISLTVFSFSMVMILLNQTASQMSNRVLDKLIGNQFQEFILGFYIGTIVYALFLLSTIRDIDSGIYVPSISVYLLIALTITDIFLFIYFLHYITQSVKYETIIHRIFDDTIDSLKISCLLKEQPEIIVPEAEGIKINAYKSGLYQGFDSVQLLKLCEKENIIIYFLYPVGTFLFKNNPVLIVANKSPLSEDFESKLKTVINIHRGQEIETNYYYGFNQLMEIAIKALSPGINDPGTAIISLRTLADLLVYGLKNFSETNFRDKSGSLRIITKERSFEKMFSDLIIPIWNYGKNDDSVQREMSHVLTQMKMQKDHPVINTLLRSVHATKMANNDF